MHMYATLAMGGSGESHKNVDVKRSWIMHLYYTNRVRMTTSAGMGMLCPREHVVASCAGMKD